MTSCVEVSNTTTSDLFRSVFRRYAAGVVVVTADAGFGPAGFTATSLASISLDPPLVSFALSTNASSWRTISVAETVVVNFLDAEQHSLARTFATSGIDRFAAPTRWSRLPDGEPVLDEAAGVLRGRIEHRYPVGDHHLVVARILDGTSRQHAPLVYHAGCYRTVDAFGTVAALGSVDRSGAAGSTEVGTR
ncbi:NADH-FMN oxidoreductase RutF, flavin reductase (DIM6/NTAB) family [Actinopolymorpha cephalotaxi]|uniref:Flavin reductase (DIM6/NTAB) family NADH-FMN oxidoreductase RutF n=1 Tax=Actinopolymorpha cephalotaxi TaxID=504797 RepID=A0A1I2PGD6_9ACTN|nr:flavin reductase family protein [Actinopolymorpha cephalotaxi]NYH83650.1 flavin reductase (DIM6/NTAB) family NADH-FMN oxidoreductase RutF [Actinopolymorpha cephalotaxi]SFG14199.1 NADH-FMN oxidoreductase RutF, flavin reductase (DIM6/NTAB) family [Actinopolymorpha cephalotaxi]